MNGDVATLKVNPDVKFTQADFDTFRSLTGQLKEAVDELVQVKLQRQQLEESSKRHRIEGEALKEEARKLREVGEQGKASALEKKQVSDERMKNLRIQTFLDPFKENQQVTPQKTPLTREKADRIFEQHKLDTTLTPVKEKKCLRLVSTQPVVDYLRENPARICNLKVYKDEIGDFSPFVKYLLESNCPTDQVKVHPTVPKEILASLEEIKTKRAQTSRPFSYAFA